MKKYFQISLVTAAFLVLVWLRQAYGNDAPAAVQRNNGQFQMGPSAGNSSNMMRGHSPMMTGYKNGTYNGSTQDAFYGLVQVQAVITGGKITAVNFLQYPNENSTSQFVNSQAMPLLQQEAIQAQSANVNGVSGASATSQAFQASLADALSQAK